MKHTWVLRRKGLYLAAASERISGGVWSILSEAIKYRTYNRVLDVKVSGFVDQNDCQPCLVVMDNYQWREATQDDLKFLGDLAPGDEQAIHERFLGLNVLPPEPPPEKPKWDVGLYDPYDDYTSHYHYVD